MTTFNRIFGWVVMAAVLTSVLVGIVYARIASPYILDARLRLVRGLAAEVDLATDPRSEAERLSKVFGYRLQLADYDELPAELSRHFESSGEARITGNLKTSTAFVPLKSRDQVLVIGPLPESGLPIRWMLLSAIAVVVLVAGAITWLLVRPLTNKLERLERAARRFSEGDLEARVGPAGSRDSLDLVATAFDQMADRVEQLLQHQRYLLYAVAHELRTPAARMRFDLELLVSDPPDQLGGRVGRIEKSLDELEDLVSEVLEYTRLEEAPRPDVAREEVSVAAEARRAAEQIRALRSDLEVEEISDPTVELCALRRHVRRVISNLVLNAAKYAGSRVRITVSEAGGLVLVSVEDDGPGIEEDDRRRIFEPFTRLDESRSRVSGGTGLGLALVHRILQWHAGTIEVGESDLGGARFSVEWPTQRSET